MAIHLGDKTKLTTEFEKILIELGGGNSDQTLSQEDLSKALVNAVNQLPDGSSILSKLCETMLNSCSINKADNDNSMEGK